MNARAHHAEARGGRKLYRRQPCRLSTVFISTGSILASACPAACPYLSLLPRPRPPLHLGMGFEVALRTGGLQALIGTIFLHPLVFLSSLSGLGLRPAWFQSLTAIEDPGKPPPSTSYRDICSLLEANNIRGHGDQCEPQSTYVCAIASHIFRS